MASVIDRPDQRRRDLARIHMGVKDLRWSDDDYRSVLLAVTGKSSAGELDSTRRKQFLDHLLKCGWKPARQVAPPQGWQAKKIEGLWAQLAAAGALKDPSEAGLRAFMQAQTGAQHARFLSTAQAGKLIEGLKAWLQRTLAK